MTQLLSIAMPGQPDLQVPVEDEFLNLAPRDQDEMVRQIALAHADPTYGSAPTNPTSTSTGSGQSAPSQPDTAAQSTAQPDTGWGSAIQHGLHAAAAGFGSTLAAVGLPDAGSAVANSISDPTNYQPAASSLIASIRAGKWLDAAEYLPRAALEVAPDLLGGAAATTAGTALAGPAGGAIGGAAYVGGRNLGQNVTGAATDAGRSTPTMNDWLQGGLLTAGEGALAGAGSLAAPAVMRGAGDVAGAGMGSAIRGVGAVDRSVANLTPMEKAALAVELNRAMKKKKQDDDDPDGNGGGVDWKGVLSAAFKLFGGGGE